MPGAAARAPTAIFQWVADTVEERFGIDLVHVKLNDTAEAVRKVLAEKTAGRDEDGSVDLIWINGENFKAMKDANLLHGPLDDILPNFALIDPVEKPTTVIDFTVPTEGLEAPWGMAKIVFPYDTTRLAETPGSIQELLVFAKANPGTLHLSRPAGFHRHHLPEAGAARARRRSGGTARPGGWKFRRGYGAALGLSGRTRPGAVARRHRLPEIQYRADAHAG